MRIISDDTLIRDLPLRTRVKQGLMQGHPPALPYFSRDRTFGEAKTLSDETLLATDNFGQTSLQEWVNFRDKALGLTPSNVRISRRVRLHSLLLAHESAAIALYDLQRADPAETLCIDPEGTITKRQEALARVRENILSQLNVEQEA